MSKLKKVADKCIGKLVNGVINAATKQDSNKSGVGEYEANPTMSQLCRQAGAEGIVLLKNINGVLPLNMERVISVFGRVQNDWFYVGYGSGGDVNAPYKVSLMQGLKACEGITVNEELAAEYERLCREKPVDNGFWGHWPMCYDEFVLPDNTIKKAASCSDTAIVAIGRSAGEDRENKLEKGSYYLTDEEITLLDGVTAAFSKVIVLLNCGGIMDMSKLHSYGDKISAVLYVWQSGMESGNAIADVLSGKVSPSGKLTDTVAVTYDDYPGSADFGGREFNNYTEDIYVGYRYFESFAPEKALYHFGFGLSYTRFEAQNTAFSCENGRISVELDVKNVGDRAGKPVVQVYFGAPCGRLGKPALCLAAFEKTRELAPGEAQRLALSFQVSQMASYDDERDFAYILEKGSYKIYLGFDAGSVSLCGEYEQEQDEVIAKLAQRAAPQHPFMRIKALPEGGYSYAPVPMRTKTIHDEILANLPSATEFTGNRGIKLADVKSGKATMEQFVAQLSNDELEALSRGDYVMNSPLGAPGNAGTFGGVLKSLREKGVKPVTTTDGPSGIRLCATASLLPVGTGLACAWNTELAEALYEQIGLEMKRLGSDILLAPGMNIHRNPLCGRNFEYFSEDPYVAGVTAAAVVKGLQKAGVSACPKHFACNNQETNRIHNDSRVSERALREIYLKGFEICVKTASPQNLMTSYNKINGVWGHYHYELCTCILRGEWGYKGNVMTDWWMRSSRSPEFPKLRDQAYRVRAGVNVLMPGGGRGGRRKPDGTLLKTLGKPGGITLGELQRSAAQTLMFVMNKCE